MLEDILQEKASATQGLQLSDLADSFWPWLDPLGSLHFQRLEWKVDCFS